MEALLKLTSHAPAPNHKCTTIPCVVSSRRQVGKQSRDVSLLADANLRGNYVCRRTPATYTCLPRCIELVGNHPKKNSCHDKQTDGCTNQEAAEQQDLEQKWGVQIALALLRFYKSEISPLLPSSCRYVPSCSEYSMQAYKKYGVLKGTILTAWRLARCNPLGGSGFDPPRWFGETKPPSS